jgi:hypothetical protein
VKKREALKQTAAEPVMEVDRILGRIQESLAGEVVPLSVADLMRLLELRSELAQSQAVSMTVGWIGECQQIPKG